MFANKFLSFIFQLFYVKTIFVLKNKVHIKYKLIVRCLFHRTITRRVIVHGRAFCLELVSVVVQGILDADLFDFTESVDEIEAEVVRIGFDVGVSELVVFKGMDFRTSALILITSLLNVVENKLFLRICAILGLFPP